MKRSIELKQKMSALNKGIVDMLAAGKNKEAAEKAKELESLTDAYNAAVSVENADRAAFGTGVVVGGVNKADDAKAHNRAFVKAVMNRAMTDSERAYAMTLRDTIGTPGQAEGTPGKGGYLVPTEQMNKIMEWRNSRVVLKNDCDVIPVNSAFGNMPTADSETGLLTNYDELSDIKQSDKDFGQISWKLSSYGVIIPVSNELLADNDVDLVGFISRRMAIMGVNTENDAIFNIMKATAITSTGADYKAILKAINTKLDAAIAATSAIYTDSIGFDYLDEMEDKNGRPLLTPSYADPAAKMFRGHQVKVLPSNIAVGSTEKAITLYVGSLSDGVAFFDREGISIAVDASAGFTQNKTLIRAIERFDVKLADPKAIAKVTINIPTT